MKGFVLVHALNGVFGEHELFHQIKKLTPKLEPEVLLKTWNQKWQVLPSTSFLVLAFVASFFLFKQVKFALVSVTKVL